MWYSKEGKNVKTEEDLQNLVVSEILRQAGSFTIDRIYNGVQHRLEGSIYHDSPDVQKRCEYTVRTLFVRDGLIRVGDEVYELDISFLVANGY